jgi:hypothetical protein
MSLADYLAANPAASPANTDLIPLVKSAGIGGLTLTALAAALAPLLGGSAPADTTGPTFPDALSSSNVTQNSFRLSWQAATDANGIAKYEYSYDGSTWTSAGTNLFVDITGRTAGTTYTMRARAVDPSGNPSAVRTLPVTTTASADTTDPSMAGSLTATSTATSFIANWQAGSDNVGVVGYDFSYDGGTNWIQLGNVLTYTKNDATASTTYPLRVRARDAAGRTSNVLSATVTTSAPIAYETFNPDMRGVTAAGNPTVYTGDGSANSENQAMGAVFAKKFADKTDGSFTCVIPNNGGNYTLAVASIANSTVLAPQAYAMVGVSNVFGTDYPYNIFSKAANFGGAATTTTAGVKPVGSDKLKFDRINSDKTDGSTTLIVSVARAATPTVFTELYRFTGVSNGELGIRWYVNGGTPSISQMQSSGLVAF